LEDKLKDNSEDIKREILEAELWDQNILGFVNIDKIK